MSTNFDLNAASIIRVAHQFVGVVPAGKNPDAEQLAMGYDMLGMIMKDLQDEGIILSTVERTTTALVAGQAEYACAADTLDVDVSTPYVTNSSGSDIAIVPISRGQYMELSLKSIQGQPTQMYVEKGPTISFFLYPTPDTQWASITFPRILLLSDTNVAGDATGLPSRYLSAITKQLAADLAYHYPVSEAKRAMLRRDADAVRERVVSDDTERSDVVFRPNYGIRGM